MHCHWVSYGTQVAKEKPLRFNLLRVCDLTHGFATTRVEHLQLKLPTPKLLLAGLASMQCRMPDEQLSLL
jgi:hypothetical protein